MAAALALAIYMILFVLKKWNFYILTEHSTVYGIVPQEQVIREQEKQSLL